METTELHLHAMFDILPDDLVQSIVDHFLGFQDLLSLEIAAGLANREQLLTTFRRLIEGKELKGQPKALEAFIHWLSIRQIPIGTKITVNLACLQEWVESDAPLKLQNISVHRGLFAEENAPIATDSLIALWHRLSHLITLQGEFTDEQLLTLRHLNCPLQVLQLDSCQVDVTSNSLFEAISTVGRALLDLSCDGLDDQHLTQLTTVCPNLCKLKLSCRNLKHHASLATMCAFYGDQLKVLAIFGARGEDPSASGDQLIAAITVACKNLRVVDLGDGRRDSEMIYTIASFQSIIHNCPLVEDISIEGLMMSIHHHTGIKTCSIISGYSLQADLLEEICRFIDFPMTSFYSDPSGVDFDDNLLLFIAAKFGDNLRNWHAYLPAVGAAAFDFLSRCPNLKSLGVQCPGFTHEVYLRLPQYCPNLVDLSITDYVLWPTEAISDAVCIEMLRQFGALNNLKKLTFRTFALTDAVLLKLAEFLPVLDLLDITDVDFSDELAHRLIASGELRVKEFRGSKMI